MTRTLLSNDAGDRATAYAMSNKILPLPQGYLCTWIDSERQNQWAVVERETGKVLLQGSLGKPCRDNHCGAALTMARGRVHAITGGHHTSLEHYVLDSPGDGNWQHAASIEARATYPSLASGPDGTLHLAFRSPGDYWTLNYCRFERGRWTSPAPLVQARKPGYIYWTNALAVGPDACLHLVFANTRVLGDGSLYHGASHLFSDNGGDTWTSFEADPIGPLPAPVDAIPLLQKDMSPDRIVTPEYQRSHDPSGPRSHNYLQIALSNPVVDAGGAPHVVVHNGLAGAAELWRHTDAGWMATPLTPLLTQCVPGTRVHMQSSLSLDGAGRLHAALMMEPTEECVWGPAGTTLVHMVASCAHQDMTAARLCPPDEENAQWLPAMAHPIHGCLDHAPPLLYTRGRNAGGFANNKNDLRTEVWFSRP